MTEPKRPSWIKDKTTGKKYEIIYTTQYDNYKDFSMDPSCYYALIKIHFDRNEIALAVCNKNHEIQKEFRGKRSQDIIHAVFKYEKQHNIEWFTLKEHVAYLGRELKKAEIHLALGNTGYYQE